MEQDALQTPICTPTYAVWLGGPDWRDPGWDAALYPADMPADWRLSFYQSCWRCAWLDAAAWQSATMDTLQSWAGEIEGGFRFILLGAGEMPPALAGCAFGPLAPDDARIVWLDEGTDLRALSVRLQQATVEAPLFLLSRSAAVGRLERVETLLELLGV